MNKHIRTMRLGMIAAALAATLPIPTLAQQSAPWPSRVITIVSPYNPGGTNDIPARILAEGFQRIFGQSVIVKNVPGAGGLIGSQEVLKAAPDGYTLLLSNIAGMIVQPVVKTPAPYDPLKDFTPIAKVSDAYAFVGTSADLPVKNVGELIAHAKKEPGKLNYSTAGSGSFGNFIGEYFKLLTGTDIVHIPAKGSAAALLEMKAGRIQLMFDPLVLPQSSDGRIKVLAVVNKTRLPHAPQIPTVREAGGPEMDMPAWYGLFGPAQMPRDIVAKLEAAINTVLSDPETRQKLLTAGLTANVETGSQFRSKLESELKLYREVKEKAKMTVE
ncbi:tripartite tricarboxylate transporter substrate binding protein [Comamonadaceae bacterium G21597-S1]|nr:tripartite tricarboxylate transporter substrate binding protein [Comamonadaceae bacterium G21597-S1]